MNNLKELVKDSSTIIVDVRSRFEFDMGHVPGSKNIPLEEISLHLNEFKLQQTPVVLYCRSGNRSGMAVSILKQGGVVNVYNGGGLGDIQSLLN